MSSSFGLSRFLLRSSYAFRTLGEVKSLSSPNLAFFFSTAKTKSLLRRQNLPGEVKFLSSLCFFFLQVNFVVEITIPTLKFQELSFLGEVKFPIAASRERRPTPKV